MLLIDMQTGETKMVPAYHQTQSRADAQRQDASDILRLAAYRTAQGASSLDIDTLVHRALSHVRMAERIERGEL